MVVLVVCERTGGTGRVGERCGGQGVEEEEEGRRDGDSVDARAGAGRGREVVSG